MDDTTRDIVIALLDRLSVDYSEHAGALEASAITGHLVGGDVIFHFNGEGELSAMRILCPICAEGEVV